MSKFDVRVITVDSFTKCRFGGNPAAVIPEASSIPQMYYPQIANEINLAQTAFVDEIEKDFFNIEFFTPNRSLNFSGHATIGAFYVLGKMGFIRPIEDGIKKVRARLKDGRVINVEIKYDDYEAEKISILSPEVIEKDDYNEMITKDNMRKILKIKEEDIKSVMVAGAFQDDILVFLKNKDVLDQIKPDPWGLKALNENTNTHGLFAVSEEMTEPTPHTYARYFSPLYGISEESATGSTAIVAGKIMLDNLGIDNIDIYQGQLMKRPAKIEIEKRDGKLVLSGVCRLVMDGVMAI